MCVISDTFENLPKILLSFNCLLLNHYNTDDTNAYDSQLVRIPNRMNNNLLLISHDFLNDWVEFILLKVFTKVYMSSTVISKMWDR